MTFATLPIAARLSGVLSVLALGLATAACGGGGDDTAVALAAEPSAAAAPAAKAAGKASEIAVPVSVMVEGCVLDRFYVPTTGTPVRALAADGRLLGHALSDGQGRFTLRLPARSDVTLQIDRPQGESRPTRVEATASTQAACLLDDLA